MTKKIAAPPLWGLVILVCYCAVGAVIISPAMGDIARHFDVVLNQSGQMMSVYLFGYALGQLLYGPLADALGRKKSLFIGIMIALLGVVICLISISLSSFVLFLMGRFVMALGSSASLVVAFILVNDTSEGSEVRKKMSVLFSSLALAPATATSISGYMQMEWGWPSMFLVFILYSLALLVMVDYFPETGKVVKKGRGVLSLDLISNRYLLLLGNKRLIRYGIMYGCCASTLYVFYTLAPLIIVELLQVNPKTFGVMNYFPNFGLFFGTLVSAYLSSRRKTTETLELGFYIAAVGVSLFIFFSFMTIYSVYAVLIPMFIILGGMGLVVGNIAGLGTQGIKDKPFASALYNFIGMSLSVLATMSVGFVPHRLSFGTLTVMMTLTFSTLVLVYLREQRKSSMQQGDH